MKTPEKVAYIKGLMDGMNLDVTKNENKILAEVVSVLEELAAANCALTEENIKLRDYIEEIDEDLGALEEFCYDLDDDDFDYIEDDEDEDDEYEYEDLSDEDDE